MTSGISQPTNPGSTSRGYAWVPVTVQSIDGNTATVTDTTTQTRQVSITNMPAKGVPPKPGEQWLIHRQYGAWTFGLCMNAPTGLVEADIGGLVEDISRAGLLARLLGTAHVEYAIFPSPASVAASTNYVAALDSGGHALGLSFTAPPSGIVTVDFGMGVNSGGGTISVSIAVSTGDTVGSGTVFLAANDNNAYATNSTTTVPGSRSVPVTGLTPRIDYNAFIEWKSTSGTMAGAHAWMKTTPELA